MKVLVTGGMGYIGSLLVEKLLNKNHLVYVVDLMIYETKFDINKKNLILIKGDIRTQNWDKILSQGIDVVYHLAGVSNDPGNGISSKQGLDINYYATVKLYNACLKNNVKRFIYPSSCSVYGKQFNEGEKNILNEECLINPLTNYAIAKAKVEKYIINNVKNKKMCTIVIRPATVYGISYRQRFDLIVNNFTAETMKNGTIVISNKKNVRPTVHINDLIRAYILLLNVNKNLVNNEIFNIAYDNYTLENIYTSIFKITNKTAIVKDNNMKISRSYYVDSSKINRIIGFERKYSLNDGIEQLKRCFLNGEFNDYKENNNYFNKLCQPLFFGEF